MSCPLCEKTTKQVELQHAGVYECGHCGTVHGHCYKGDSYTYVRPQWFVGDTEPNDLTYYDLMVVGSEGQERRHGWFDKPTRLIVQTG